jgi:hypothetical protein
MNADSNVTLLFGLLRTAGNDADAVRIRTEAWNLVTQLPLKSSLASIDLLTTQGAHAPEAREVTRMDQLGAPGSNDPAYPFQTLYTLRVLREFVDPAGACFWRALVAPSLLMRTTRQRSVYRLPQRGGSASSLPVRRAAAARARAM